MQTVTIIGAGIFGLSCAYALARKGIKTRIFEARHIGAGASGGQVGALAPHDPAQWNIKKQIQLEALIGAEAYWNEVREIGGLDAGWARTGRLAALPADPQQRIDGAAAHWPADYSITRDSAPHPLLTQGGTYLRDNLTARISPLKAVAALAAALRKLGCQITEYHPVTHPDRIGPGPCIWATGAEGLAMLGEDLGRDAGRAIKGQSASFGLAAPAAPQLFLEGIHIVPHADGTVAIGSTSERDFDDPASTDGQLDALIERARQLCPPLRDAPVLERWAGLRPRARSRAPLLGPWPGRDGHYIANGGFKIGLAMAPWAGSAMLALLSGEACEIPPEWLLS